MIILFQIWVYLRDAGLVSCTTLGSSRIYSCPFVSIPPVPCSVPIFVSRMSGRSECGHAGNCVDRPAAQGAKWLKFVERGGRNTIEEYWRLTVYKEDQKQSRCPQQRFLPQTQSQSWKNSHFYPPPKMRSGLTPTCTSRVRRRMIEHGPSREHSLFTSC